MIKAIKVKLYPTRYQEGLMFKSAGIARFSYNWGLAFLNKYYEENNESYSIADLRKKVKVKLHSFILTINLL